MKIARIRGLPLARGIRQRDPTAGMSENDRCRVLCFGVEDAADVFTGNSVLPSMHTGMFLPRILEVLVVCSVHAKVFMTSKVFPEAIGCGIAGGTLEKYEYMLQSFAHGKERPLR